MTRVYVATTREELGRWHAAGVVAASPDRFVAEADDEDSEYAALMAAADASTALQSQPPRRRVVVVAEVDDPDADIPLARVRAVHADAADRGEDADPDDDLAWFATQEVGDLLAG